MVGMYACMGIGKYMCIVDNNAEEPLKIICTIGFMVLPHTFKSIISTKIVTKILVKLRILCWALNGKSQAYCVIKNKIAHSKYSNLKYSGRI